MKGEREGHLEKGDGLSHKPPQCRMSHGGQLPQVLPNDQLLPISHTWEMPLEMSHLPGSPHTPGFKAPV